MHFETKIGNKNRRRVVIVDWLMFQSADINTISNA